MSAIEPDWKLVDKKTGNVLYSSLENCLCECENLGFDKKDYLLKVKSSCEAEGGFEDACFILTFGRC